MIQVAKNLLLGFEILSGEWGKAYKHEMHPFPLLPTQYVGAFLNPPPSKVAEKLIRAIGFLRYKQLIGHVLSIRTKKDQAQLVETIGSPDEHSPFFYLEAVYTLVPASWDRLKNDQDVFKLLLYNLFSFFADECTPYLLRVLETPLDKLLPLLEELLSHSDWIIRENIVCFFYGIHTFPISPSQWAQVQALLNQQLSNETNAEVRRLIERELSYIHMRREEE